MQALTTFARQMDLEVALRDAQQRIVNLKKNSLQNLISNSVNRL